MTNNEMVFSAHSGTNATMVEKVCELYLSAGQVVADVTYGKGAFWRNVDTAKFTLLDTDIEHKDSGKRVDFRNLRYAAESVDVVVLDPPYMHNPGKPLVDRMYNNNHTTHGLYHRDILKLYVCGMIEAKRVLKSGGFLWVKCQDEIESGKQCWTHIEIHDAATELSFYAKDLFVLLNGKPHIQRAKQCHARKNHSYLWILQKKHVKKQRPN